MKFKIQTKQGLDLDSQLINICQSYTAFVQVNVKKVKRHRTKTINVPARDKEIEWFIGRVVTLQKA
jgi:hypothetical protein